MNWETITEALTKENIPFALGEKSLCIPGFTSTDTLAVLELSESDVFITTKYLNLRLPFDQAILRCKREYREYLREQNKKALVEGYHLKMEKMLEPLLEEFRQDTKWNARYQYFSDVYGRLVFSSPLSSHQVSTFFPFFENAHEKDCKRLNAVSSGIEVTRFMPLDMLTTLLPSILETVKKADELVTDDFLKAWRTEVRK